MNVANLQLEGLIMAVAAVNKLLVTKGLVLADEVDEVLHGVEASLTSDERLSEDMSPAQRDAVCFPVRLMRLVNARPEIQELSFSDFTRMVGQSKRRYNDQM